MASRLLNGLIGYWKLDELSGNRLDSSGNGLTLTNNNGVASVSKGDGAPLNLPERVSSFALLKSLTRTLLTFDTSLGYTMAAWVYVPTGAPDATFIVNGAQRNVDDCIELGGVGAGIHRVFHVIGVDNTTVMQREQGGGNMTFDAWHLQVARYNGTAKTGRLMKDNVDSVASTAIATSPVFAAGFFGLGCNNISNSPNAGYTGRMSSVGLWNRELTDVEASLLWNSGTALVYPFTPEPILATSVIRANCTAQDFSINPGDTLSSTMALACIHVHDNISHVINIVKDADNGQVAVIKAV